MRNYAKPLKKLLWLIGCGLILLFLTGCCDPCKLRHYQPLPLNLLAPNPMAIFQGKTNEDLVFWAVTNQEQLKSCNQDKEALSNISKGD